MATSSPSASGVGYLGFNLNPSARTGAGAYGSVPGGIGAPPSIFSQVNAAVPGAAGLAPGAASNIAAEEAGVLSPGTLDLLQNKASAMGITAGLPGGLPGNTISNENLLTNMGLTSEQLSNEGNQNYLAFLGGVGQTQLQPNLLADIAQSNATLAAAPDPAAAAAQQQADLMRMYNLGQGPVFANSLLNNPNWFEGGGGTEAGAMKAGGGEAFLPAGSRTWQPGSGFQYGPA